jgi:starch synthase
VKAVPLPCINPTERLTGLPMPIPGARGYHALREAVRSSDVVMIHDALYATSILAMVLAKKQGKRVILVQHIAAIPFSSPALRALMKLANLVVTGPMLRAADCRVFISDTVRRDLIGEPPRQSYDLLFNGVDSSIFHPHDADPPVPVAVAGIDFPATGRRVLFVGRYVEKKGLFVLRELAAAQPDLTFFLAGSGPIRPSEWRLDNVHDLGPRTPNELAELYRWADLLFLPSVGEGYPLVIQEAMACGLPVICGEPSNRADPEATKWVVGVAINLRNPEESADRCASTIGSFSPSQQAREEMARYAAANYDWTAMAGSLVALARDGNEAAGQPTS